METKENLNFLHEMQNTRAKYRRRKNTAFMGYMAGATLAAVGFFKLENYLSERADQFRTPAVQIVLDEQKHLSELNKFKKAYPFVYSSLLEPTSQDLSDEISKGTRSVEFRIYDQERSRSSTSGNLGLIGVAAFDILGLIPFSMYGSVLHKREEKEIGKLREKHRKLTEAQY